MATYKLVTSTDERTVEGSMEDAIEAAKLMESDLQPQFGVTVEDENGEIVAKVRDGQVED